MADLVRLYRPAALCRLTIRLDDFTNEDGVNAADMAKPLPKRQAREREKLRLARNFEAVRRASFDDDIVASADVLKRQKQQTDNAVASGVALSDVAPDDLSIELLIAPSELTVECNPFKMADKATMTFALRDAPLDPDIVRSMLVDVFMGTVRADDFGDPQKWVLQLARSVPMFRGYADLESMSVGEDFTVQIQARSLEARLMDLKLDPLAHSLRIEGKGEKISHYIRRLIATVPEFSGEFGGGALGVRLFPNVAEDKEWVLSAKSLNRALQSAQSRVQANGGQVAAGAPPAPGTPDPAPPTDPAAVPTDSASPSGQPGVPARGAGAEMSMWDLIVRATELAGLIPVYDPSIVIPRGADGVQALGAQNLLLVPPQNLMETPDGGISLPAGAPDKFEREFTTGGAGAPVRSQVRLFVWGHNLKSMKIARKFGRIKAPRVRVVCYNHDGVAALGKPNSRQLESIYPKTGRGTSVSAAGTGGRAGARGHTPLNEMVTKEVRGITNQKDLDAVAVALYHAMSRQEMTVQIETDDLASYIDPTRPESHNENPDVLTLRPGSPCRVVVARNQLDPAKGLVINQLSELFERRYNPAFLRKMLAEGGMAIAPPGGAKDKIDDALAKLEKSYQKARLTDWFYVRIINHKFSMDDGWSASIELVNYIESRSLPRNLSKEDAAATEATKQVSALFGQVDRARAAAREEASETLARQAGR